MDSFGVGRHPMFGGMGLFSDGGTFATKPYICGSAYFLKMMDFKKVLGVTLWMVCIGDL